MTDNVLVDFVSNAREKKLAASSDDPVTEDAAALAFAERYIDKLRFDHDVGKWFVWSGTHWQQERTGLAFSWARELARDLAKAEPEKVRLISSKTSFAGGVEKFARTDRAFAVTSEIWDCNTYLLGTPEGVVDLRTGEIRPALPEDYITKLTSVAPAAKPDCPRWMQFLREATNDDQPLINFLQAFAGYMLTGDTKEHSLLFIYGGGGNGKSVFQNTCAGIMGDYAKTAAMETFVASSTDKHPTDLAMLHGARLVTASETEEGRAWAEARIKQMTGGDKISARFMRQDFFEFVPQFKLMLIGNHQPTLRNVDEAARRRFNIVPFIHKPPAPDRDLEAKLRAEWPAILRWMIEGCLMWQRVGLVRPQIVLDATEEYFSEQDSVSQWIDDRCETGKGTLWDTSTNLFKSWTAWANANGEKPGTTKWFAQVLKRKGFKAARNNKKRGFRGIEAKPDQMQQHWSDQG
ncbi:putative DNA primase/helicase [Bradyrhizobium japonicum]|uniref:phage/plasmid primase, P4 family n=1 Tax=Bradyrhizobium japonicum TaxID=375 RepID=UPI002225DF3A|nr:phage/plasmid primase, P4 family [Bradyrhizobium japonicum]MCW2218314.1 putative DNA primase/helicase [Bradyrhizobium japonicum]MCW2342928.1 putative DNA primase/helicase [Bradyrhizobium japonicum]